MGKIYTREAKPGPSAAFQEASFSGDTMEENLFIPGKNYIAIVLLLVCLAAGAQVSATASAADLNLTTPPGTHPTLGGESLAKIGRDLALLHREYESYLYNVNALADQQFKSNKPYNDKNTDFLPSKPE